MNMNQMRRRNATGASMAVLAIGLLAGGACNNRGVASASGQQSTSGGQSQEQGRQLNGTMAYYDPGSTIVIRNASSYPISGYYISPVNQSTWGPNQFGEDVLYPGETFTLSGIACDTYDLRLVDQYNRECIVEDKEICDGNREPAVLTDEALALCQSWTRQ